MSRVRIYVPAKDVFLPPIEYSREIFGFENTENIKHPIKRLDESLIN